MELKTARLTVLVDPAKKKAFEALCARQDVTPSQVQGGIDPVSHLTYDECRQDAAGQRHRRPTVDT
jgi:hypothetical protein